MAEYTLEEIPVTGDNPNKEKLFKTPKGNQFRVRLFSNIGSLVLTVLKNDGSDVVIASQTIPMVGAINTGPEAVRQAIERQIVQTLKAAEEQEEVRSAAKGYLMETWGLDIDSSNTSQQSTTQPDKTEIKFLSPASDASAEADKKKV